jgi:GNAT superfamily N-acetyltransferase
VEFELLGWPPDGPTLSLDHQRFAYAGKFVMSATGKAVVRGADGAPGDEATTLGAVAFNEDRTDPATLWLRYVTVRADRRGDGLGARLCAFAARRADERGYERVRIAVNNPFAYEAVWKAGFGFTGEETGIAELVCERPGDRSPAAYRAGLSAFEGRDDLTDGERTFLAERRARGPPAAIEDPR